MTTTTGTATAERDDLAALERLRAAYAGMTQEIGRVVIGQNKVIEELLTAILSQGHCVLVGVPEVDLGCKLRGRQVWAVRRIGGQASAVEAAKRGHPVGMRGGDPPTDACAHAVAGDPHRARRLGRQEVDIGRPILREPFWRQLLDQRVGLGHRRAP